MSDGIEIVKLPPSEWSAYKALRLEALKEEPHAFGSSYADNVPKPDSDWQERLAIAMAGNGNCLMFAKEGDRLVGMIGAFTREDPHAAMIVSVYVPKEHRGQGIAKKLMAAVLEEVAKDPAIRKVWLTVNRQQEAALALYRSFGFETVREEEARMGDGNLYWESIMEREMYGVDSP